MHPEIETPQADGPLSPAATVVGAALPATEAEGDPMRAMATERDEATPATTEADGESAPGTLQDPTGSSPDPGTLDGSVEALLFSTEEPLAPARLAQIVGSKKGEVLGAIDRLNVFYAETHRAFRIAPLAGGFQLVTTPEHAEILGRLHKDRTATRLSRAALETLAIIAFKQPVTRAEIDTIRGVSASDGVLRHLMERRLARIAGRAEAPGRPLLYGTTRDFLAHFGLHTITDLPRSDELQALLAGEPRPVAPEDDLAVEEPRLSYEHESHSVEESDDDGGDPSTQ